MSVIRENEDDVWKRQMQRRRGAAKRALALNPSVTTWTALSQARLSQTVSSIDGIDKGIDYFYVLRNSDWLSQDLPVHRAHIKPQVSHMETTFLQFPDF